MNKCKHCGKDLADGVQFCAHCGKSINEAPVDKSLEAIKSAVKETVQGEMKPIKDAVDAIDARVKAIEALPLKSGAKGAGVISKEVYRGYKIHDQGESLREKFSANPNRFKTLSDPEQFDSYCKFMLDFKAAITGDVKAQMALQEARQKATDMSEGSNAVGGYAVPVEYEADLIKLAREASFLLQNATVIPMGSNVRKYPAELTHVSNTWEDEAGEIDEQNPTLSQVTLTAKKLASLTSGISSELLQDSMFDIVGWLTEQFMYTQGLELDNQALNGTGSPCSGVLTAACGYSVVLASTVLGSTNFSAISADKLSEMIYKLSDADAVNAKFVFNRLIMHYIRTLKDNNGQFVWQKPGDGRPGTIWETPYIQSVKGPSTSASSTAFVVLGNWKYFYVGQRMGMTIAVDPYTDFAKDQVRFRAIRRVALAMARSTAFVRLLTA